MRPESHRKVSSEPSRPLRRPPVSRRTELVLCQFSGCDAIARVTVGITPLCALHESAILDLLDMGQYNGQSGADTHEAVYTTGPRSTPNADRRTA